MEPILNFAQLTAHLKKLNHRKRIAVVCANDPNTEYAISRALEEGIAEFLMIGDSTILKKYPTLKQYPEYVKTIHIENSDEAAREAVRIVREGGADILMKGIINTDNLLHAILDKEKGLLPKGKILTHLAVMEIPTYHKLLFFSDAAVIPRPTLQQRIEMIWYAICTCRHFGIEHLLDFLVCCRRFAAFSVKKREQTLPRRQFLIYCTHILKFLRKCRQTVHFGVKFVCDFHGIGIDDFIDQSGIQCLLRRKPVACVHQLYEMRYIATARSRIDVGNAFVRLVQHSLYLF